MGPGNENRAGAPSFSKTRALAATAGLAGALLITGCQEPPQTPSHQRVLGGDPQVGRELVSAYACNVCHAIPDTGGIQGRVGPPLEGFGRRTYIGGHVPNRPDNLVRWIMDAPSIAPGTAMPNLGIPEAQARHIAAYLYALR